MNGTCRREEFPAIQKIDNFCEVELENNEDNLRKLISKVGPVAG